MASHKDWRLTSLRLLPHPNKALKALARVCKPGRDQASGCSHPTSAFPPSAWLQKVLSGTRPSLQPQGQCLRPHRAVGQQLPDPDPLFSQGGPQNL